MTDLRRKEAASVSEITWQGQKIPIKNENVRLAIVRYYSLTSSFTSPLSRYQLSFLFIIIFTLFLSFQSPQRLDIIL